MSMRLIKKMALPYRLSLMCRRSACNLQLLQPRWRYRTLTSPVLQKVVKTVQNDPFIKLSLSLCVLVGGGTLVMELYKKLKKSALPEVLMLPGEFSHHSVYRQPLISNLHKELKSLRSKGRLPLLYITGPPGCGKTELVRQFCTDFAGSCRKWLGLKTVSPVVMCLDATSPQLLHLSLVEAAGQVGVNSTLSTQDMLSTLVTKASTDRLPWLLVVDNLMKDTVAPFKALLGELETKMGHKQCAILVTTQLPPPADGMIHCVCDVPRLDGKQSLELVEQITGLQNIPSISQLFEILDYNAMSTALAASTIKMYHSMLRDSELETIVDSYQGLLVNSGSDVQQAAISLYCEAAVSDYRARHVFDFLGSSDLKYPLLVTALPIHLGLDFYGIPEETLAPPVVDPILGNLKESSDDSLWSKLQSVIPFLQTNKPSDKGLLEAPSVSQDEVAFIRQSPLLSFKHIGNLECVTVNSAARYKISQLFSDLTTAKLDEDYLSKESKNYACSSWFKSYRAFDSNKALKQFYRRLPGLSSPGVFTEAQFAKAQASPSSKNCSIGYSDYVHIVSHHHRVLTSLVTTLKSVKGELKEHLMKMCLMPHFEAIKNSCYVSESDRLIADISLIDSASSDGICHFENLIAKQQALLGTKSVEVANSLVSLADLQLSVNNASSAKELLQRALGIYNQVPAHLQHGTFSLDISHSLSSLGLACGELGEKERSKDFYDQALTTAQAVPPNGRVGLQQRKLVASLLVSVTHAYLCLGDLPVAKKYCELTAMMLQSLYPQGHEEVVRLLNIRSVISALMGSKEESSKFRMEAAKLKIRIES